jgi:nitrite reductase (cytochrome c-552)
MKKITELVKEKPWVAWALFGTTVVVIFLIGLFAATIVERRSEAIMLYQVVKPIEDWEPRDSVWGLNYPREYETYLQTLDTTFASKYCGSVTIDMLKNDPKLVILWAGYAFSRDYYQGRGHYYAIKDVRNTLRTGVPQPGTCWTCKSTDVPRVMSQIGVDTFYHKGWSELGKEIVNPIGCSDCHDPKTMNLRVTRPALIEAYQRQNKDITKSTYQEMRSLVCAQCHVEYYFQGAGKYLTFPWDKGMVVDSIEQYYDNLNFTDYIHGLSRAPIIKAQHPDWELFTTGIHYKRGLSCSDCHMPYKNEGGVKFTDHHIQSPLNNISRSCQVCHRESEETLKNNVYDQQDKIKQLIEIAEENLVKAHIEAKTAWDKGATEEQMKPILMLIRHAQWRWDFVAASHGGSFHAPVECARILGTSIQKSNEARILLTALLIKLNVPLPVIMPDISTKEKAQQYIGLDMAKIRQDKNIFISTILPQWDKAAEERQSQMKKY